VLEQTRFVASAVAKGETLQKLISNDEASNHMSKVASSDHWSKLTNDYPPTVAQHSSPPSGGIRSKLCEITFWVIWNTVLHETFQTMLRGKFWKNVGKTDVHYRSDIS
jgi:hypothetical protein